MPIYKKGQKENPGNYSLHLGAGEDYGTDDLEYDHMACTEQEIRPSYCGFRKGQFSQGLIILILYDYIACLREKLRMLSIWTRVKSLMVYPTAFSWRN